MAEIPSISALELATTAAAALQRALDVVEEHNASIVALYRWVTVDSGQPAARIYSGVSAKMRELWPGLAAFKAEE